MSRVYNFSSGPSMLPQWVLERAKAEMLEYLDSGQSVMEMSHRSPEFIEIMYHCEASIRELLAVPDNYHILFIQGGASLQFSMIPMNLATHKVQIINTGEWTKKAFKEHQKLVTTEIVASSEDANFSYVPKITTEQLDCQADYLYICQNNTVFGSRYPFLPPTAGLPLVADLSSMIMSEPINIEDYGLIFAGAQKNLGSAGVCVVILRDDLLKEADKHLPTMLDYRTYIANDSLFNTPPTYSIYICDLVCRWIKEEVGGLEKMYAINQRKAKLLYDYLDESELFSNSIAIEDRSIMNVTFVANNAETEKLFISEAANNGFINLAGHRSVGGMRASIYNAMPEAGIIALIAFMKNFEVKHG